MFLYIDGRRRGMRANETTLHPFIKVNHYRSKYGLQHGAFTHNEQHAIKGPTSVNPFKRENQRSNLYKKQETRNTYKPHKKTTTKHQSPYLGQVQTIATTISLYAFHVLIIV